MTRARTGWSLLAKLLAVVLAIFVVATLVSLIPTDHGVVRALDFVREPVFWASAAFAVLSLLIARGGRAWLTLGFLGVAAIQLWRIWPYLALAQPTVALDDRDGGACFTALGLNVLQSNEDHARVAALIDRLDPDLLLLMEVNDRWMRALAPQYARYPETIAAPKDNTYGMAFATRLTMRDATMPTPTTADTPTLYATLVAENGAPFEFIGLHPRPPLPGKSTEKRDASILRAATRTPDALADAVVMGDFNDVPWSTTTSHFRDPGGWRDPRVGRGAFPTFPADYSFVGWPLDHVMVKGGVSVRRFLVLEDVGSDHLPVFAELCLRAGDRAATR